MENLDFQNLMKNKNFLNTIQQVFGSLEKVEKETKEKKKPKKNVNKILDQLDDIEERLNDIECKIENIDESLAKILTILLTQNAYQNKMCKDIQDL
jgi:Mg2+ and Co2+ transporter CorA